MCGKWIIWEIYKLVIYLSSEIIKYKGVNTSVSLIPLRYSKYLLAEILTG